MQSRLRTFQRCIILLIVVFISIQLLNQLLIYIGNNIIKILSYQHHIEILIVGIVQQTLQIGVAILLSTILLKSNLRDFGLNFWNFKRSIKYFLIFASSILIIYFLYLIIVQYFIPNLWMELRSAPVLQRQELFTKLLFQSIFPGLGEELLFRGFLVTLLINRLKPNVNKFLDIFSISILSGLFFAIAHIYFDITTFEITHIDTTQLLLALFSGTCYSLMFIKTKSLLSPILSHNFANVASTIIGLLIVEM